MKRFLLFALLLTILGLFSVSPVFAADSPIMVTELPVQISQPVYQLTVSGSVRLNSDNAVLRLILIDQNQQEYLIYETYSALENSSHITINKLCEETCDLNAVRVQSIKIESYQAQFSLKRWDYSVKKQSAPPSVQTRRLAKIQALNNKIKITGKKWIAGETDISKRTYSQKKQLLGITNSQGMRVLPNLQGFEYYKSGIFEVAASEAGASPTPSPPAPTFNPTISPTINTTPYPTTTPTPTPSPEPPSLYRPAWDWRSTHGQNWITAVKDQQYCGSCWAFAAVASTESVANLYYNRHLDIDLSEQESVCNNPGSCSNGGSPSNTFYELQNYGIVTEKCYPYTASETCPGRCADGTNQLWGIKGFSYISSYSSDSLKKSLILHGPITFGIYSWWHVMSLVGFDKDPDAQRTIWIVKNSWGTSWGENGFARLIVPESERYLINYLTQPYFITNPNQYQINCEDRDNDTYCSWGLSETKPDTCPASCRPEKDCDDSQPLLGPFAQDFSCQHITNRKPGDGNNDGVINESDYTIWLTNYGKSGMCGPDCGDYDYDGTVSGIDYVVWLNNYGN